MSQRQPLGGCKNEPGCMAILGGDGLKEVQPDRILVPFRGDPSHLAYYFRHTGRPSPLVYRPLKLV